MFVNWYKLQERQKLRIYQTELSKISMKIIKQNTSKQFFKHKINSKHMNITNKFWMDDKMESIWNKQKKIIMQGSFTKINHNN